MNSAGSEFDRRISIEVATETKDAAGDPVLTWGDAFPLWARKKDTRGREAFGAAQIVREADTVFKVRASTESRAIAPESHRVVYKGVTYEIVGIADTDDRGDAIEILTCSRPDRRGARARETPVDA